jgi:hypothetical protein
LLHSLFDFVLNIATISSVPLEYASLFMVFATTPALALPLSANIVGDGANGVGNVLPCLLTIESLHIEEYIILIDFRKVSINRTHPAYFATRC